jgi:hypothetical protein
MRKIATLLVLTTLLLIPQAADADEDLNGNVGTALGLAYWAFASDVLIGAAGTISLAGNAVALGVKRPARGWMVANYVHGTLNLGLAAAWAGYYITESPRTPKVLAGTLAHTGIGLACLGIAIATQATGRGRTIVVSTLNARDEQGAIPGLSVQMSF